MSETKFASRLACARKKNSVEMPGICMITIRLSFSTTKARFQQGDLCKIALVNSQVNGLAWMQLVCRSSLVTTIPRSYAFPICYFVYSKKPHVLPFAFF